MTRGGRAGGSSGIQSALPVTLFSSVRGAPVAPDRAPGVAGSPSAKGLPDMEVDDQRRLRTVHADDRVRKCRGHLILRLHNLDGRARCGGAVDDDAVRKVVFDHEVGEGLPRGHIEGDRVLVRETRPGRRFPSGRFETFSMVKSVGLMEPFAVAPTTGGTMRSGC